MSSGAAKQAIDTAVPDEKKALGAFYTDAQVAFFLVWWAVRSAQDTVMDPSFGGAVFLQAACDRLLKIGGRPSHQVFGVEIDPVVHVQIASKLSQEFGVREENLLQSDFFDVDQRKLKRVDAIVGNPPFIRYQRFSGDARKRALRRAADEGLKLSELSSSWAPFLVHSIAMLKRGGRLAMVIPVEIGHAAYALPLLDYLQRSFGTLTFLTFQKKLFPHLSEDTLLLLAEDKGSQTSKFLWRDFPDVDLLSDVQKLNCLPLLATTPVNSYALTQGQERLIEYFLPKNTRELYRELKTHLLIKRLGELADVGIGYVTGANDFFHLSPEEARHWGIPEAFLRPAVRRSRGLTGLRLTSDDWQSALEDGETGYLLHIKGDEEVPDAVRRYLDYGEQKGVSGTYKCRTRSPWFRVPHVYRPDALLSYMSGVTPRLVANDAGVVAPNSLHVLRLHHDTSLMGDELAALWQTSLTRLSVEIEGHALGGGMLKLEPTEAENVRVASPHVANDRMVNLIEELDALIRNGDFVAAQSRADKAILMEGIGLSQSDCHLLELATNTLRNRRYSRSAML
jgi:adenine-specific DNA-methyltransferase